MQGDKKRERERRNAAGIITMKNVKREKDESESVA